MKKKCCVIGAGNVGSAIAIKLNNNKILDYVVEPNKEKHNLLLNNGINKKNIYISIESDKNLSDIIFITVPDNYIVSVAKNIIDTYHSSIENRIFIHCSGNLEYNILEFIRENNGFYANAHPFQTFYKYSDDILDNICWSYETFNCNDTLVNLITIMNGIPIKINTEIQNKSIYHATAVVVSNYLSSTINLAKEIGSIASLELNKLLPPIVNKTIENNYEAINDTIEFPITGPVVRGDIQTVLSHIKALKDHLYLKNAYIYATLSCIEMAFLHKKINLEKYNVFKKVLLEQLNN